MEDSSLTEYHELPTKSVVEDVVKKQQNRPLGMHTRPKFALKLQKCI